MVEQKICKTNYLYSFSPFCHHQKLSICIHDTERKHLFNAYEMLINIEKVVQNKRKV